MDYTRNRDLEKLKKLLKIFPSIAILGPRQCGKSTLAKSLNPDHFFDLENPRDYSFLENADLNLATLKGTIAIDEIQIMPKLFSILRYLIDLKLKQKFILLGSASPILIKESSESLAGRIGFYPLGGFSPVDVGFNQNEKLWIRGSFPRAFLAKSNEASNLWKENYIKTFLERDIPALGISIPANTLRRFWTMLSHYHGQILNYSELARSFGISDSTVRRYIEILEGTFMVRTIQPWHTNIGKRLIKNPKLYLNDSGLFHYFSAIQNKKDLISNPKLGASFEGYVIQNIIKLSGVDEKNFYFWRTHAGSELDLFWQHAGKSYGLEVKFKNSPSTSKSMHSAIQDLNLKKLFLVYPGELEYKLTEKISVIPFSKTNKEFWFE